MVLRGQRVKVLKTVKVASGVDGFSQFLALLVWEASQITHTQSYPVQQYLT